MGGAKRGWRSQEPLGFSGTYGELLPQGVAELLAAVGRAAAVSPEDVLFDLGSGRGRLLLQAVLTAPSRAVGVEISEVRSATAEAAFVQLRALAPAVAARLRLVKGDFRHRDDWSDATIAFLNSACFTPRLMFDVVEVLGRKLQLGALVYTVRRLPGCHRGFLLVDQVVLPFTWSRHVRVFVYAVAPRPPAFRPPHEVTWLSAVDWQAILRTDERAFGREPLALAACTRHAELQWGAIAPAAARLCLHAAGGQGERLTWEAAAGWLQSWASGPGGAGSPPSITRCAWAELHSRHELERRGAASDVQPAAAFAEGLAELSLADADNWTLFHHGAAAGAPAALRALLRLKGDELERRPSLLSARDRLGRTPLQVAGDNASVALLLQARARPEERADRSCGALGEAAGLCLDARVIEMLASAGCALAAEGAVGEPPLVRAAAGCHTAAGAAVVQALLAARAQPDARGEDGRRPLHVASDPSVVRILVAFGAEVHERDELGAAPLHRAAARRSGAAVAAELLHLRAATEAADGEGRTPLMLAASAPAARELLAARAEVAARDAKGSGALHHAAGSNRTGVVAELLAAAGSSLFWRNDASETPLDVAARSGFGALAEALLAAGAEPTSGEEGACTRDSLPQCAREPAAASGAT